MRLNLLEIIWAYIYFQGIKYLQEETKSDAAIEANLEDGDEEESRQQWSNPIEFLLSCVAMSVGLGKDLFRNGQNTQITLSLLVALGMAQGRSRTFFHSLITLGIDFITPRLLEVLAKYLEDLEKLKNQLFFKNS